VRVAIAYLPAVLWWCVVLLVNARDDAPGPAAWDETAFPIDKVGHLAAYGVLGFVAGRGWLSAARVPPAAGVAAGLLLLGAIDELQQLRLAHRTASVADWLFDAAGILIGFTVARALAGGLLRTRE
jgi:VanZ family protein